MKNYKFLFILILTLASVVSCELPDNVDPKGASEVPPESLFSKGLVALVDQVNHISVNENITRLFAQYNAQILYVDEGNFNLIDRRIPDAYFENFYLTVLMDLKEAKKLISEIESIDPVVIQENKNKTAILDILEVYSYQCLVDAFGNVPYSEALQGLKNPSPSYDDAAAIYSDLLARISNDITALSNGGGSFGDNDFLYEGDVDLWKAFAASLKLRIAMRLSDVSPATAKTAAEQAITSGVISSHEESALFKYIGVTPYTNSIYEEMIEGGRLDFVPANAIVDYMNSTNDPRRSLYFTQVDTSSEKNVVKLAYVGGNPGDGANVWASLSHFSDAMFEPNFSFPLIDLAEVEFMLSEAAARGYTGAGDAETHYDNGVIASIESWGGNAAQATAFLAQAGVTYDAANWKRSIGIQKWVALYNRGVEAWAEIRRLDIDDWATGPLVMPAESLLDYNIRRMPYPYVENDINKTNKDAAATAIGGDDPLNNLFWDVD